MLGDLRLVDVGAILEGGVADVRQELECFASLVSGKVLCENRQTSLFQSHSWDFGRERFERQTAGI